MFNFLKKWSVESDGAGTLPSGQEHRAFSRHYQPELINQLKDDHQHLLSLCNEIQAAIDVMDYRRVTDTLTELRTSLEAHLLIENAGLYAYLKLSLAADKSAAELMCRFQHEMSAIGIAAMEFINKYQSTGVPPTLAPTFSREFAIIYKTLASRIQKEELILYPLYLP